MSRKVLIIGGTRNMGYYLAQKLAQTGCDLTLLNRGITADDLPPGIHRLHADRRDRNQLRRAVLAKRFDVVVDFVMFNGEEAENAVDIFRGSVDHFILISSGQVYLVRENLTRPFREDDYAGRLIPAPSKNSYAYEEWRYGIGKREAEDVLRAAWQNDGFPYTSLRLPMVNSVRDHYRRLHNYVLRLADGGPILVPDKPDFALNHVYALDAVDAIIRLIEGGAGKGEAYNIAQDEHPSLDEFLQLLASLMHVEPRVARVDREALEADGFLPDCSPFSERWMSALDNSRGKSELGISYTPLRDYLALLVAHYQSNSIAPPLTFRRRRAEIAFAQRNAS